MSLVVQPPGIATPLHRHAQEAEALFVLEGLIEYRAGEETRETRRGLVALLAAGTPAPPPGSVVASLPGSWPSRLRAA